MAKGLDRAIELLPRQEALIRELFANDDDFEELCEHFAWMSEVATTNPDPQKRKEYADLRDVLEAEFREYLDSRARRGTRNAT